MIGLEKIYTSVYMQVAVFSMQFGHEFVCFSVPKLHQTFLEQIQSYYISRILNSSSSAMTYQVIVAAF